MPRLLIVSASTRPVRIGPAIARWFAGLAEDHGAFEVDLVDLVGLGLPLLDEPEHPRLGRYVHAHTWRWSRRVAAADAFALVMPEYNAGISAALKNAIDFLHAEWQYKPVAHVSYSGGPSGGARAVQMMAPILTTLRMTPVVPAVGIARAGTQVVDGAFSATEQQDSIARVVLGELDRLSDALRPLRPAPPEQPAAAEALRGDPELLALLGARGRGVLATNAADGRPHLSVVDYACRAADRRVRVSVTAERVKTRNVARDPRASLHVSVDDGAEWAVAEGTASLTPVATGADDPVLDELVDLYRAVNGEHPDWDDYRRAMVADRRRVLSLDVDRVYGLRRG